MESWTEDIVGKEDRAPEEAAPPDGYLPPDERTFSDFVGPNADFFLEIYRDQIKSDWHVGWRSFNPAVLLGAVPWLLYRKLYAAAGVIAVAIAVAVAFLPGFLWLGLCVWMSFMANNIYVISVRRRLVQNTDDLGDFGGAGGTWTLGAALGAGLILAVVGADVARLSGHLPDWYEPSEVVDTHVLPGCESEKLAAETKEQIIASLLDPGDDPTDIKFSNMASIANADDPMTKCRFLMTTGKKTMTVYLAVKWVDQDKGLYNVKVGRRLSRVLN